MRLNAGMLIKCELPVSLTMAAARQLELQIIANISLLSDLKLRKFEHY